MPPEIARLFQREVTVIRPGTVTNRYGQQSQVWTVPPATETTIRGFLQQTTRGSESRADAREESEADFVLYCEATQEIKSTDRLRADSLLLYVTAPPVIVWGLNAPHHQRVELRFVEG